MEFHSIGLVASIVFIIFCLFTGGGLYLLFIATKILNTNFENRTGKNIFFQLYFIMAYSLLGVLYRQALSFKLIVFTDQKLELYLNVGLGAIYVIYCLFVLRNILKSIEINRSTLNKSAD